MKWLTLLAALLACVALAGCGYTEENADPVEDATGGECQDSGWFITEASNKYTLFNCLIDGELRCISFNLGVVEDETEWARDEFADSSDRPDCVGNEDEE